VPRPDLGSTVERGEESLQFGAEGIVERDGRPVLLRSTVKAGSDLDFLLADIAVVISVALQYGVPAAALAHSVARIAGPGRRRPSSSNSPHRRAALAQCRVGGASMMPGELSGAAAGLGASGVMALTRSSAAPWSKNSSPGSPSG
jgi:hypothetical protein